MLNCRYAVARADRTKGLAHVSEGEEHALNADAPWGLFVHLVNGEGPNKI